MTEPEEQRGTTATATTATRAVVVAVAVVAVLLLGAAIGLLVKLPGQDDTPSTPAADSVDVGFLQDMAAHHLQGVTMANLARDKTTDSTIRQLAFDIQSTQLEQVGRMKGWLSLWGHQEQSVDGTHMKWMTGSAHDHSSAADAGTTTALMPGMASTQELNKLRGLSGPEFDVYFLQLMLRHHQGGAPMAQYAAGHAGQSVVRTLADNMLGSQTSESAYMRQLLGERGASPLP
ncbi:DUF305 domain-containing protein [Saccharothrix longispora]|uniref:Uncharacterized protein (DUF305 family) n=1 Tax=Saccharothrix longispora TaxID=33920 RepID=A0ABU1Q1V2_9PSEU|nr:DUF305 domain-containing protein [Saccharothrix longispora]MDR6596364.1 uncharacterized protein (DUF305 family) [Saccharothrix longispora]